MIHASQLFNEIKDNWIFNDFFDLKQPVYEWLPNIQLALKAFFAKTPLENRIYSPIPQNFIIEGDVFIGENVRLPALGTIQGPAYIGNHCELRPGVYIRGNVIIEESCVLGNSCEFKNALLLDRVQVPHFNYVGDSILGTGAHLGAGAILSNLRFDRQPISMRDINNDPFPTGLKKLGAILGDYAEVGCNAVLQPGSCLFPQTKVFPCEAFKGTRLQ